MTITIKKNASKIEIEKAIKKMESHTEKTKGAAKKFFGANKNEVDGMAFQKKVRQEWH